MATKITEYAPFKELLRRHQKRERRKMLGVQPGSGYEIRGGVKRRISPERLLALKKRGRLMARKASQQVAMRIGRQRASALKFASTKKAKRPGQPLKASIAHLDQPGPVVTEHATRFNLGYILDALLCAREGDPFEAVRRLTQHPTAALSPLGGLANEIVRQFKDEHKQVQFFDAEPLVEQGTIALYVSTDQGGANSADVLDFAQRYGDAGIVANAGDAMSEAESSQFGIILLKPSESVLDQFGKFQEAVTSSGVSGFIDTSPVGVNQPHMVSLGGQGDVGSDIGGRATYYAMGFGQGPRDGDVAHLKTEMPPTDDKPIWRRMRQRQKQRETQWFKRSLPLGLDPDLGKEGP